jgi:hypothetical protein
MFNNLLYFFAAREIDDPGRDQRTVENRDLRDPDPAASRHADPGPDPHAESHPDDLGPAGNLPADPDPVRNPREDLGPDHVARGLDGIPPATGTVRYTIFLRGHLLFFYVINTGTVFVCLIIAKFSFFCTCFFCIKILFGALVKSVCQKIKFMTNVKMTIDENFLQFD